MDSSSVVAALRAARSYWFLGPLRAPARVPSADMALIYEWRGAFDSSEANHLHAEAFETRLFDDTAWNWNEMVDRHSLGWVTARDDGRLVGFVNVLWDGLVHAWLQDTMVARRARGRAIGTELVARARAGARQAGCEWLHVDFDEELEPFYLGACGFTATKAGLIALQEP
jgi:GNAT superfamily N-acetyltransferase